MLICNKTFLQFLTDLGVAAPLTLPVTTSTAEIVWSWRSPSQPHEEAALVTTAALSAKLCDPPVTEERNQNRIDSPLDPAIKLLDRDIQRHIRQEAQDQWRILLESSDHATNPSVTGFSYASWAVSGRTRHQTFQSPLRENPLLL